MSTNGRNPESEGAGRTGPITEAELLGAIEAESPAFVELNKQGTASSRRIAAMRGDRAVLLALGGEPAPAWLLDAALDEAIGEFDGETLRRLGEGTPSSDRLPVSRVTPERFTLVNWLRTHPQRVAFSLAAAVVLLVGGVAGLSLRGWLRSTPAPSSPIAQADNRATPAAGSVEIKARPIEAASVDATGPRVDAVTAPEEPAVARAAPTLFEAAGLIEEGRLVVMARGGSSPSIAPAIEALTRHRIDREHSWSLSAGVPEAALALLDLPKAEQTALASDGGPVAEVIVPERSMWSAKLHPTPTALAALLESLRDAGLDVELREVDVPVLIEPVVDPDDVLWWSRAPSSWKRAAAIPVVVETLP